MAEIGMATLRCYAPSGVDDAVVPDEVVDGLGGDGGAVGAVGPADAVGSVSGDDDGEDDGPADADGFGGAHYVDGGDRIDRIAAIIAAASARRTAGAYPGAALGVLESADPAAPADLPDLADLTAHAGPADSADLAGQPKRTVPRTPPRRTPPPAPTPIRVLADDPITRDAALAILLGRREIRVLPPDEAHAARVVLVLVERVTGQTVAWMREAAEAAPHGVGFVVVGDGMREHHLLGAVAYGPVSVLPRRDTDFDRIVRAIAGVPEGRLEMPDEAVGWLVGRLRTIHKDVLEPRGLTGAGLEVREVGVIRLLAEGLDTAEIAKRMNYSERTVKSIIHGVLTQRQLRNRAHAVAFALRAGVV